MMTPTHDWYRITVNDQSEHEGQIIDYIAGLYQQMSIIATPQRIIRLDVWSPTEREWLTLRQSPSPVRRHA